MATKSYGRNPPPRGRSPIRDGKRSLSPIRNAPTGARHDAGRGRKGPSPPPRSLSVGRGRSPSPDPQGRAPAKLLPDGIERFHGGTAYLVTDMSGFTRLTRKLGAIHFSSLIMKMRQLLYGLFKHYSALFIEADADNFCVVFRDVRKAVQCALHIYKVIGQYNEPIENEDYRIVIGGVAVGYGTHLYLDTRWGRLYGPHAESTFRLGEDVCETGEVRVTDVVFDLLNGDPELEGITFEEAHDEDEEAAKACATETHYILRGELVHDDYDYPDPGIEAPPCNKDTSEDITRMFLKRLDVSHEDRKQIDGDIVKRYQRPLAVMMYGVKYGEMTHSLGPVHVIRIRQIAFIIIQRITEAYGGRIADERICVFYDCKAAVTASLEIRRVFEKYNDTRPRNYHIPFSGVGVHFGDFLFVEGTNVHWGDPVNTASKLGEDIAQNKQFFITATVYDHIKSDADFKTLKFEKHTLEASKVQFDAYEVIN